MESLHRCNQTAETGSMVWFERRDGFGVGDRTPPHLSIPLMSIANPPARPARFLLTNVRCSVDPKACGKAAGRRGAGRCCAIPLYRWH